MSEDETPESELELGRLRLLKVLHQSGGPKDRIHDWLPSPKTTPEKMDSPSSGNQSTSP